MCRLLYNFMNFIVLLSCVAGVIRGQKFASSASEATATGPFFIHEPENVTVIAGKRVMLKCVVGKNDLNRKVQWTFDDFGLGVDRRLSDWPHLRMVGNNPNADWNLEIDPVTIHDDGRYQCQMTPLRSRYAQVNVWVPPEDPFIEDGPVIHVKESVQVKLECVARGGKPPAKINWYDHHGNLVNDATYRSYRMRDSKLFEARSQMTFTPRREHHNQTFRCEAWNEAGDNLRPALARLFVQYAPSVTVTPVRPGMIQEGDKAAFRCSAVANPPVYEYSYKWFIDSTQVLGQSGYYFEIFNVTRSYHDKQVRCSVENNLGVAMGLKSLEVKYGPTFLYHPRTTSGDRLETITLHCIVDSNPPPQYYWTKGSSREVVSHEQNITLNINEDSVGNYYCHAEAPGYTPITSRNAEVLMTGRPKISSSESQTGVEGENVNINCAAVVIPEYKSIVWTYHDSVLEDTNPHYRIINSPMQHGVRSTLIIKQAIASDFGPYTCAIQNEHGVSELRIELEEKRPFPFQIALIAIFAGVILVLLITILVILFRKRICCSNSKHHHDDKDGMDKTSGTSTESSALANNVILKVNNIDQMSNGSKMTRDFATPSQLSNEADSAWEGSDNQDFRNNSTQLFRHNSDLEPDFPPKPDVISTGYFPYAQYVRDYNPPPPVINPNSGNQLDPTQPDPRVSSTSPMYSTISNTTMPNRQSSLLNVTDPRYSATYGNPLLRQCTNTAPRSMQYSTFMPGPVAPPQLPISNNVGTLPYNTYISLPMSSRNQLPTSSSPQVTSGSTSTPNSSIGNMACLPEDHLDSSSKTCRRSPQETPSPPPAPPPVTTTTATTTTAIYARVNPNLKRDKTNNNNFSSTFAPIHSTTDQKLGPPQPMVNSSLTNVLPQYQAQRPALNGVGNNSLQRPGGPSTTTSFGTTGTNVGTNNGGSSPLQGLTSSVGTHV